MRFDCVCFLEGWKARCYGMEPGWSLGRWALRGSGVRSFQQNNGSRCPSRGLQLASVLQDMDCGRTYLYGRWVARSEGFCKCTVVVGLRKFGEGWALSRLFSKELCFLCGWEEKWHSWTRDFCICSRSSRCDVGQNTETVSNLKLGLLCVAARNPWVHIPSFSLHFGSLGWVKSEDTTSHPSLGSGCSHGTRGWEALPGPLVSGIKEQLRLNQIPLKMQNQEHHLFDLVKYHSC